MRFTRAQIWIISVVTIVLVLIVGTVTGIIPGLRKKNIKPPTLTLNVWGIMSEDDGLRESFDAYSATHQNVTLRYEQIDPNSYETTLLNALAAGKGPDVFMFHNAWLPKHFDKIAPVDATNLNLATFRTLFPTIVEQDFAPDGLIYALPLSIDTLALTYNADIFDAQAIAVPPADWLEFQNLIPKLRQINKTGTLARTAAAIGGTNQTVNNASDLLSLLMLQAGTVMTDKGFTQATFAESSNGFFTGIDALNFYTKFSNPTDIYYTWNEQLGNALDSFAQEKTAMIFAYKKDQELIAEKNPLLRFKVTAMPQPNQQDTPVNFAVYWGFAVSNKSQWIPWGWDLILALTTQENSAEVYMQKSHQPPALRSLIQKYADDPELGVFAKQALTARSWPQVNEIAIRNIFSQMINAVVTKQLDSRDAAIQAQSEVSNLIRNRR